MNPTQQEVHDVFGELYQRLTDAYWVASTSVDKDRFRGAADAVFDILTALNREDIKSRTAEDTNLKENGAAVTKKLGVLQSEIDSIIHNATLSTTFIQSISQGFALASKFF